MRWIVTVIGNLFSRLRQMWWDATLLDLEDWCRLVLWVLSWVLAARGLVIKPTWGIWLFILTYPWSCIFGLKFEYGWVVNVRIDPRGKMVGGYTRHSWLCIAYQALACLIAAVIGAVYTNAGLFEYASRLVVLISLNALMFWLVGYPRRWYRRMNQLNAQSE